jgi:hypothetical protein
MVRCKGANSVYIIGLDGGFLNAIVKTQAILGIPMKRSYVGIVIAVVASFQVSVQAAPVVVNGVKYKSKQEAIAQVKDTLSKWLETQSPTSLRLVNLTKVGGSACFVVPSSETIRENYVWTEKGLFSKPSKELVETVTEVERLKFIFSFEAIKKSQYFETTIISDQDSCEGTDVDYRITVVPEVGGGDSRSEQEKRLTEYRVTPRGGSTSDTFAKASGVPHKPYAELLVFFDEWRKGKSKP